MRLSWYEITEDIRIWRISDERDYLYILMEQGKIVFLREVNEGNQPLPKEEEK